MIRKAHQTHRINDRRIGCQIAKPRAGKGEGYTGRISVIAENSSKSIASVTNAIAKQDGDVVNLRIVHRAADFCEMAVDVEVRDLRQLINVIASLRAAPGVHQVDRARG